MTSILFTTIVIIISVGIARRLLGRIEPEYRSDLERFLFRAGIGLGIVGYLVMLLGLLQALRLPVIAVLFVLLLALGWWDVFKLPSTFARFNGSSGVKRDPVIAFALLGIVAVGLWALIRALAPPIADDWDSLAYHLAVPKLYLQHGGIYYIPFVSHSNFPFTVEMLYTTALSFGLIPAAKLFHFAYWLFTLLALYVIGRAYYGARTGVVAALIFAVIPLAAWEATTAYIDLATTFYIVLAVSAMLAYSDSGDRRWVIAAGITAGLAASTKMTALGVIPLLVVWTVLAGRGLTKEKRKPLYDAAVLAVIAFLSASPWYLKSWIQTGNPVYPFLYNMFGGRGWNSALADQYRSLQMQFGMGHGLYDFVMAPWNLAMHSDRFYDRPGLFVGFALLAFIPFIVIAAFRDRRSLMLAAFSIGFGLLWFGLSHQSRYLLPGFALLSIPAAYGLCNLPGMLFSRIVGAAALALSTVFAFLFISQMGSPAVRVALGLESHSDYLSRSLDTYRMSNFINRELPKDVKVVLFNDTRGFYLDRDYLWGDWAHNTVIPYSRLESAEQFARFLRSINVTHALIRGVDTLPAGHQTDLINSAITEDYFREIASDDFYPVTIYEVSIK